MASAAALAQVWAGLRHEFAVQALPATYQAFVVTRYGPHRAILNEAESRERISDARDLLTLLKSQRQYKELMDKYYPLDEATNKDYARAAARRVGLSIPE